MGYIAIRLDPLLKATPGDFGAVIDENDGVLRVPLGIGLFIQSCDVRSASDFVCLEGFSREMANAIEWDISDVEAAFTRLKTQLTGYVPDTILNPRPSSIKPVPGADVPPIWSTRRLKTNDQS